MRRSNLILRCLCAALAFAIPRGAAACREVKVCVWWNPDAADSAPEQDYLVKNQGPWEEHPELFPARGARVMIVPPPPEPPIGAFLDPDDGCVVFETQYTFGVRMVMYTEALMGTNDNVYVRVFDEDVWDPSDIPNHVNNLAREHAITIGLHQLNAYDDQDDEGTRINVLLEPHYLLDALASVTETVYRIDHELGATITGAQNLTVVYTGNPNNDQNDPAGKTNAPGGPLGTVQMRSDYHGKRFVFGHETGHVLQSKWGGLGIFVPFSYPPVDTTACGFSPEAGEPPPGEEPPYAGDHHGLLSAEVSNHAVTEGFAHFVAAATFNDPDEAGGDGVFRYYKSIAHLDDPGTMDDPWEVLLDADNDVSLGDDTIGVVDAHVATDCSTGSPSDWGWPYYNDPTNGIFEGRHISSEVDWLRLFWRFVANNGTDYTTPLGDVSDAFDIMVGGAVTYEYMHMGEPNAFEALSRAAGDISLGTRFDEIADEVGVFNDGS